MTTATYCWSQCWRICRPLLRKGEEMGRKSVVKDRQKELLDTI
jgi:hypothetical protein